MSNTRVIPFPNLQKEIAIPRRQFRSAYAERIAIPYELKEKSSFDWWKILNELLYPIGFILLAADMFL